MVNKFINFYGRRSSHLSKQSVNLLDKYKNDYVIDIEYFTTGNFLKLINNYQSCYLEIGFGSGDALYHSCIANSKVFHLGVEVFLNGIASLYKIMEYKQSKLDNLKIFNNNFHLLANILPENCFDKIYIFFPDPWSKNKHRKRRLINSYTIKNFYKILKPQGELLFISDHADYVSWVLELFISNIAWKWNIKNLTSFKEAPENYLFTKYHIKALESGSDITYLSFLKQQ